MAAIPVPTSDCVGIDVTRNGQVVASYDARNGYVDVPNRAHRRLLERTFGSKRQIAFGGGPVHATKVCGSCGRLNFADNQSCPACGADISAMEVVNVPAGT